MEAEDRSMRISILPTRLQRDITLIQSPTAGNCDVVSDGIASRKTGHFRSIPKSGAIWLLSQRAWRADALVSSAVNPTYSQHDPNQ